MPHRILLTGANGFIGSHILSLLLTHGHSVRAITRSNSKTAQILSDFPSYPSTTLDFGIVPDITLPNAFDEVVKSDPPFDIVIHTASPFLYKVITSNTEFLNPALKGTLSILQSIKSHAPSVKRVILTSSCAAVVDFARNPIEEPKKIYTEKNWNPVTWEEALSGSQNMAYQASKKFAELAAWDFIAKEKPNFDLVTLCPPMVYGPLRHSITHTSQLNQSNSRIHSLFLASSPSSPMPPNGMHAYVDVRDLALAHMTAMDVEAAGGKRFVVCAGRVGSQEIADVLRGVRGLEERVPRGVPGESGLDDGAYECLSWEAERFLGVSFRGKEETFGDLGVQLIDIERKEGGEVKRD